ncbi:coat protein [ssRNA phage SRR6960509_6]|uniref:Coat protein n=1 Tax=ssRNA phage SRR6960509_6 TaxID=2786533 RepID=A0A8S5L0L2_9VIRU|nr:coat protein [ssRNA phage SRR6960509_6]DAD50971.1 TPA_asm: coat protein [ssRNA phage SRR6960509_6]
MPAMTTILVFDDATTPAEFTFEPITDNNTSSLWRTNDASTPEVGQKRLTLTSEKLKGGKYKTSAKLEVPVMEVVLASSGSGYASAPKVAHTVTTIVTQFSDARATAQDRSNCLRLALGAIGASSVTLSTVAVNSAVQSFLASPRPILRAFVSLIRPN